MAWNDYTKVNPFANGNINGNYGVGGIQGGAPYAGGTRGAQGGSAVDKELADARRFFQPHNGTGQLQPFKEEAKLFYMA